MLNNILFDVNSEQFKAVTSVESHLLWLASKLSVVSYQKQKNVCTNFVCTLSHFKYKFKLVVTGVV